MDPTPDQAVARDRIHDLLAELADLIGPRWDGQTDDDLEPEDQPVGQAFISEWVLIAAWVDEDGNGYTTRVGSANLLTHHRVGLLHEGLYGFGD